MPPTISSTASASTASRPAALNGIKGASNRRKRVVRRRGRLNTAFESDEEFEREVGTDSDSEALSSAASSDDSDTEPLTTEETGPHILTRVLTPSTSQTPDGTPSSANARNNIRGPSFFQASTSWSEMVSEEKDPMEVIDFAELGSHEPTTVPRSLRPKKPTRNVTLRSDAPSLPSPPLSTKGTPEEEDNVSVDSPTNAEQAKRPLRDNTFRKRPFGQTARQAYQSRLESDPSYVPTVGEFWGHDDRLLDRSLRSLSGWWRGRWQGGFRGRGQFARGIPSRGRGGLPARPAVNDHSADAEPPQSVPAVDKQWTHDGFEELKKNEDRRQATRSESATRGFIRGRGSFVQNRGRGGFVRGGFTPSPSRSSFRSRPWFREEHKWTKQLDAFLYMDPSMKPIHGQGPAVRIKLPGREARIIRLPLRQLNAAHNSQENHPVPEYDEKLLVVRLPKKATQPSKIQEMTPTVEQLAAMDEPTTDEVFTVRPHLVTVEPIPLPEPRNERASTSKTSIESPTETSLSTVSSSNAGTVDTGSLATNELKEIKDPVASEAEFLPSESTSSYAQHPIEGTPGYGPPFAYPVLPPGVVIGQQGIPVEAATGRPVYLSPPVYPPRPVIQHYPTFSPGHMHHHSTVSGDFAPSPMPPTNGYMEPSFTPPMFALPRQSSAVQIRSPGEEPPRKPESKPGHRSSLSTAAPIFQPSRSVSGSGGRSFFTGPSTSGSYANLEVGQPATEEVPAPDPGMMMYPYPQPYYYPEAYMYQYVDMAQPGQYEMYHTPPDSQIPLGTVYY